MKKITLIVILFYNYSCFSQCDGRYQNEVFSFVNKTTINYSDVYSDIDHQMDIYIPDGDTYNNRPLILFMHGGTFYAGDKSDVNCVDFCENFAKKGYVCASVNYRLIPVTQILLFLTSNQVQYQAVLEAVMDTKSAIRFFRKSYESGNIYGIDTNAIFVGGYSAGGVNAIHSAYIDNITDLPTSPINVQNLVSNLGGIEGDAGNYGYSSKVNGVISFAGGIQNLDWIDINDEPIVSIQGEDDLTINFNCGPATNNPAVLELCGLNQIHPIADNLGIINDKLIFYNTAHSWPLSGNNSSQFTQAIDFTKDFLYPLLPCNNVNSNEKFSNNDRKIIKITDILGREIIDNKNNIILYVYDNGEIEKRINIGK